jgi:nucleotide-binding universal stress UspA family protein
MTRYDDRQPITVGVDGTEDGLRAAEYAALEARQSHRPIRLLHACHVGTLLNPMPPLYGDEVLRQEGIGALDAAERRIRTFGDGIAVDKQQIAMSASAALVQAGKTSALVVVGHRTINPVERFLAGSTSSAVASKVTCPLVSVPVGWKAGAARREIVVGADGSASGRRAIEYAFDQASKHRMRLLVVSVWEMPMRWYLDVPPPVGETSEWLERRELALAEDLAGYQEQYPDVTVRRQFVRSPSPARALCDKSEGAALLVVGKRGLGGVIGLDLGWTARSALAHASCPVAVVHHHDHASDENTIPPVRGTTVPAS